jgi:hypothetical protein
MTFASAAWHLQPTYIYSYGLPFDTQNRSGYLDFTSSSGQTLKHITLKSTRFFTARELMLFNIFSPGVIKAVHSGDRIGISQVLPGERRSAECISRYRFKLSSAS